MKAKKVKASFRVIDGIDPWSDLESQLDALERFTRIAGDEAAPIATASSDDQTKAQYLASAAQRISDAVKSAKNLSDKEKAIAADQATRAIEKARDLQRALVAPGVSVATGTADKLRQAEAAAKALVPWYLAIGALAWLAIGVVAFVIYDSAKSGKTQRRTERMRAPVVRGARKAGVL
jgi:CHASE3 domain sensor protein